MIFDDFENDDQMFKAFSGKIESKLPEIDLSLDDLILERKEKENNKDFSSYYEIYRIEVNQNSKLFKIANKENMAMNFIDNKIETKKGLRVKEIAVKKCSTKK